MKTKPTSFSWKDKTVLVTGGTGSFGKMFTEIMLREHQPKKLIVFSRDELKQHEMQKAGFNHDSLRYFIGDVRDVDRLRRAFAEVDVVVHAAALKQVPACEYNPMEAILTNIMGARNIIEASLDCGVERVLALSTDKAVNPVNLYGATKLCAEKLFVQSNAYAGQTPTRFACVRYGNVVGSRGSVLPIFLEQKHTGKLTITDERMTRFWLTLEQGVRFAIQSAELMSGGEIFVPKIPSMRVVDLAKTVAPNCRIDTMGIRPGEKLHEVLVSEDESRNAVEREKMFVLRPAQPAWPMRDWADGKDLPDGFRYASDVNPQWMTDEDMQTLVGDYERGAERHLKVQR